MGRNIKFKTIDFINAVHKLNGKHTTEIAEYLGCDRRTALIRLKAMALKKQISRKKRGPVWFWFSNYRYMYEDYLNDEYFK